ncbi:histone acetyltransferase 1 [Orbilia ellipsospora]|uniref:Histone acetyltransferase type B catalytic subunit n=1 Tax=Orbilia ellipsospora TaxID=2528407 RepID=A0AAV9XP68_9PEZI
MDDWTVPKANDAIHISLVPPSSFPESQKTHSFNPALTYQLFDNETIYGYKNLSVDLQFRQDDMSPSLCVKYDEKLPTAGASSADAEDEEKIDQVEEILQGYLPSDTPSTLDLSPSSFTPPGALVNTYTRDNSTYEIYHSNLSDPQTRTLIHRMQILVLFFIEAGSAIDTQEEDEWLRNRWDVFLLYERLPDSKFSFVGYCTVHKYWYFTKSPNDTAAGTEFSLDALQSQTFARQYRARISQFLILPPFQQKGHARELYAIIIKTYLAIEEVKEITVEDPSTRFEELRDVADFKRLKENNILSGDVPELLLLRQKPAKEWIETQRGIAKMPLRQFQRMIEMLLLAKIFQSEGGDVEHQKHRFELYVKERLYRHNRDVLVQLEKGERAEKLTETYMNVTVDYEFLLSKAGQKTSFGDPARKIIAGKRPAGNISTIVEDEEMEEEEEEELEPPSKKMRVRKD